MKTYIVMISETFPAGHVNAGLPTNFMRTIKTGVKKHTIRNNYPLWKKRFNSIQAGKAVLSLRAWMGRPYRSSQVEIKRFTSADGIGLEKVSFLNGRLDMPITENFIINADILAANDGLSPVGFVSWFQDQDLTEDRAIIHFTNFRYAQ